MEELFKQIDIFNLIYCGAFVSIVVEAIGTFAELTKGKKNLILLIVAMLVTFVSISFINTAGTRVQYLQHLIGNFLLTLSFAVLFYSLIGKWFVSKLFVKIKEKLKLK